MDNVFGNKGADGHGDAHFESCVELGFLDSLPPGFGALSRLLGARGLNLDFVRKQSAAEVLMLGRGPSARVLVRAADRASMDIAHTLLEDLAESVCWQADEWIAKA